MKFMNEPGLKRLNIVLPERTVERLNYVKNLTCASSATDVIKSALITYEAVAEHIADGGTFYIKKEGDDRYTPVAFIFEVQHRKTAP